MSNRSKNIERQMKDSEFRAEHEATRAEFENSQKAYQELQRYRKSSLIELDYKSELAKSLFGILPLDITLEEAREERLSKM